MLDFNKIVSKIESIDFEEIKNFDKLGFEIGVVRDIAEGFYSLEVDKNIFYIYSAGIYFEISKESAEKIFDRIGKIARYVEDNKNENEEKTINIVEKIKQIEKKIKKIEDNIHRFK